MERNQNADAALAPGKQILMMTALIVCATVVLIVCLLYRHWYIYDVIGKHHYEFDWIPF